MPGPKFSARTAGQIKSLVRQNPGAAAKQIVRINNNIALRQNALNSLRQSNISLRNINKDIANTYLTYGQEPPFNPYSTFGYDQALHNRDSQFFNWKSRFTPNIPEIKVYAPTNKTWEGFFGSPIVRVGSPIYRNLVDWPGGYYGLQPSYKSLPVLKQKSGMEEFPLSEMEFINLPRQRYDIVPTEDLPFKNGGVISAKSGIHIKKENRGKFTSYCGGKVTSECIARGKHSSNPAIRKRATFAANARKWKH